MNEKETEQQGVVTTDKPVKKGKTFAQMLEVMKPQFQAALPKHMHPDRMIRVFLTEYRKVPKLAECTQESLMGAMVQAAQLGLEPGLLGQAWILPYKRSRKVGNEWQSWYEAQLIPGYKGLIALARRSGEVTSINTEIVYEEDDFKLELGIDAKITHIPFLDGDRGKPKLVYGVAKFKDGGYHLEWMSIADVNKIRQRSKSKDDGPWVTDYEQMTRKTVIRRMANYLPMSVELANALQISDAVDEGKRANLVIDGEYSHVQTEDAEVETPAETGNAGLKEKVRQQVEHRSDPKAEFQQEQRQPEPERVQAQPDQQNPDAAQQQPSGRPRPNRRGGGME